MRRRYRTLDEMTANNSRIFAALHSLNVVPWENAVDHTRLDMDYYYNNSGDKIASKLVTRTAGDSELTPEQAQTLAQIAWDLYGINWTRQYATLSAEYDPISNYDMKEELSGDTTVDEFGHTTTRTDALSHSKTGTEQRTDNLTDERALDLENQRTANLTDTRTVDMEDSKTVNLSDARTANLTDSKTVNLSDARTANLSDARTANLSDARTAGLTHGKTGTETTTPGSTIIAEDEVYGFNSTSGTPSNRREQTSSGQDITTYNLSETDTGTDTTLHTGTDTTLHTGTDTTLHTGTDTALHTGTDTTLHTGTESTEQGGTDTTEHTGTDTTLQTGTDTTTHTGTSGVTYNTTLDDYGTQATKEGGSNTRTREYTLTRKGNIGVTTTQQMLTQERELWIWNFFRDIVYPDLDSILTIPIY